MTTTRQENILVVGGYGMVGRSIVSALAARHPGRLVIAGRSALMARRAAAEIGYGATGQALDIGADDVPDGTRLAVVCVDAPDARFAKACLGAGIGYVDVSGNGALLEEIERLDETARAAGAAGVLSVGLAPGVTNLMAASLVRRQVSTARLDLYVVLGVGEQHGTEAVAWTFANFGRRFTFFEAGQPRGARGMRGASRVAVPGRRRPLPARRFDFPEQRSLARTLEVPSVSSWLAFDLPAFTVALAAATTTGLPRLVARRPAARVFARAGARLRLGSDRFAVVAEATEASGTRLRRAVAGRREARVTALVAARVADAVLADTVPAGVHHIEQAVDADTFLGELSAIDPDLELFDVEAIAPRRP